VPNDILKKTKTKQKKQFAEKKVRPNSFAATKKIYMNIIWGINEIDIRKIKEFVSRFDNPFVQNRISKNVQRQNIVIDKDSVIKNLFMCLLTTQQRSGPNSKVGTFLRQSPFPLTNENISNHHDIEIFVRETLLKNELNRYINRIPSFFTTNFQILQESNWQLIETLRTELKENATKATERRIADYLDDKFLGFGPKQSRNFLQGLGLTKFEIPIDSRITNWFNKFGFPVTLSSIPLQDKEYYHFVSDGIQQLCNQAEIYPCALDAAIFSSFDSEEWTEENAIY